MEGGISFQHVVYCPSSPGVVPQRLHRCTLDVLLWMAQVLVQCLKNLAMLGLGQWQRDLRDSRNEPPNRLPHDLAALAAIQSSLIDRRDQSCHLPSENGIEHGCQSSFKQRQLICNPPPSPCHYPIIQATPHFTCAILSGVTWSPAAFRAGRSSDMPISAP